MVTKPPLEFFHTGKRSLILYQLLAIVMTGPSCEHRGLARKMLLCFAAAPGSDIMSGFLPARRNSISRVLCILEPVPFSKSIRRGLQGLASCRH